MVIPEHVVQRPWTKFYPEGFQEELDIPSMSYFEILEESAKKFASKRAIVFMDSFITYGNLLDLIHKFANALKELGVKKGDKVALYLPNSPQFIIAYFAILENGAVVTPMNPLYTAREVTHQVKDAEANTIICLDLLYKNVRQADVRIDNIVVTNIADFVSSMKRTLGRLFKNIPYEDIEYDGGVYSFKKLIQDHKPERLNVKVNPDEDLAVLPYTGGTTGIPKGVMLTHKNIVSNIYQSYKYFEGYGIFKEGQEVLVALLPFYHIYGQTVIMGGGLTHGQTLLVFPKLDIDQLLNYIQKYRATVFYGVPTLYNAIINHPRANDIDFSSLKLCLCGADTLHMEIARSWEELTKLKITEGYGLTETSPVTHANPYNRVKVGSIGIPIPNTVAGIMDPESNEFLPPGEVGEIVVKGPQIMKGYWKNPEETSKVLIRVDGEVWFRTGDIGKMDEEGYFYFVERKRDLIKYKGYSVFPGEIESVLYDHPSVKECAVVGIPDENVGQIIRASVVLKEDYEGKVTEEDLLNWCRERLAPYKVPKSIEFRSEIPKSAVGKVLRRKIRDESIIE